MAIAAWKRPEKTPAYPLSTGVAVFVTLLLAACAGSGDSMPAAEQQECPGMEILVCTGGTVSKTGRIRDREPRICDCRPHDENTN